MNYQEQEKMAAEAQYQAKFQSGQLGQSYAGGGVPTPTEPTLTIRLKETLGYLAELSDIQGTMRRSLVGPEPCDVPPNALGKNPIEPPIEQLLAEVCQRAAMLVSEARSIRNRL